MKKSKLLFLCALLISGALSLTACGGNRNNGSEAPYEDETNKDVNDTRNNMYNNTQNETPSSDLQDAGRNLMDSIKDTGDAIRDGVDNLGNKANTNNRTNP